MITYRDRIKDEKEKELLFQKTEKRIIQDKRSGYYGSPLQSRDIGFSLSRLEGVIDEACFETEEYWYYK